MLISSGIRRINKYERLHNYLAPQLRVASYAYACSTFSTVVSVIHRKGIETWISEQLHDHSIYIIFYVYQCFLCILCTYIKEYQLRGQAA